MIVVLLLGYPIRGIIIEKGKKACLKAGLINSINNRIFVENWKILILENFWFLEKLEKMMIIIIFFNIIYYH